MTNIRIVCACIARGSSWLVGISVLWKKDNKTKKKSCILQLRSLHFHCKGTKSWHHIHNQTHSRKPLHHNTWTICPRNIHLLSCVEKHVMDIIIDFTSENRSSHIFSSPRMFSHPFPLFHSCQGKQNGSFCTKFLRRKQRSSSQEKVTQELFERAV